MKLGVYDRFLRGERLTVAELDRLIVIEETQIANSIALGAKDVILSHLRATLERMRERRAELAPAPKPGEAECCAGTLEPCATCPKPRPCEDCAALRDATDGRR